MSEDHPVYEQHPALHQAGDLPTADAAKLLIAKHRRHVELSPGVGLEAQKYALSVLDDIVADWKNMPSQPAPPAVEKKWDSEAGCMGTGAYVTIAASPAGEPDLSMLVADATERLPSTTHYTSLRHDVAVQIRKAYNLGLAARPKVEDAEIVALCAELRRPSGIGEPLDHAAMNKGADFLERLAVRNKQLADYAADCGNASAAATERAEATEADLRTKETQLALADDLVSEAQSCFAELRDIEKSNSRIDWLYGETSKYLNERDQSRQQAAKEGE